MMNDGPSDERPRCVIRFLPSERSLEIRSGEMTLLDAVKAAGLPIASACGSEGACARCGVEVVAGAADLEAESEREARIKARNRIDACQRLACRVRPTADLTVRASYW